MLAYLDESGDLGWNFDKPVYQGGSSRYMTITALTLPETKRHLPKRIIRDLYNKFHIPTSKEKKGGMLTPDQRNYIVEHAERLLVKHSDICLYSITVYKPNVSSHIRTDANKLYNYMIELRLLDAFAAEPHVTLVPDPRSIKVESGNSLIDYLQTRLWFYKGVPTQIELRTEYSERSLNLQFTDMLSNTIWRKFERGANVPADRLLAKAKASHLFFPR